MASAVSAGGPGTASLGEASELLAWLVKGLVMRPDSKITVAAVPTISSLGAGGSGGAGEGSSLAAVIAPPTGSATGPTGGAGGAGKWRSWQEFLIEWLLLIVASPAAEGSSAGVIEAAIDLVDQAIIPTLDSVSPTADQAVVAAAAAAAAAATAGGGADAASGQSAAADGWRGRLSESCCIRIREAVAAAFALLVSDHAHALAANSRGHSSVLWRQVGIQVLPASEPTFLKYD